MRLRRILVERNEPEGGDELSDWVLADVGGTNTRMAWARAGALDRASIRWFQNDAYPDFTQVLAAFDPANAEGLCIAIAGPVTGRHATLTNRDWHFDADGFGLRARLVNDLEAVGHALGKLPDAALHPIIDGSANASGQHLVVGVGTGFNISLRVGEAVMRAELGHASLPAIISDWLAAQLGKVPFDTVEALFSGRGLQDLHAARTGLRQTTQEIVTEAPESLALMGKALGIFATQLLYHYLPLGGIILNGGLSRALMESRAGRRGFLEGFERRDPLNVQFKAVPVSLVVDDAAALYGCAALARL